MANERILVVEDEEGVALIVQRHLESCGYVVAARVASGEEALAQAPQALPHLALMDIHLAGQLDGVQTAIRLREQFDIPVVFMTGLADDETLRRSQAAKAFGYVVKPFRQDDLKTSIDLALNKHQVEHRLRQVERSFTPAIRAIRDGVITTDDQTRVTYLNPEAERLTGWSLAEATAHRALQDVFPLTAPGTTLPLNHSNASAQAEQAHLRARDGTQLPVEYSAAPIRNDAGAIIGRVLVFREISERLRATEELTRSREQLRELAAHVETLREDERTRIAREVHDELGQMITGLRMDLAWMEKRLPSLGDESLRQALLGKARSMFELLDHLVKAVRKISSELRPVVLDLGLPAAMEWQAREWEARTGIACQTFSPATPLTISNEIGTALFRIFQESLTNVARHAQATSVEARLGLSGGCLTLEVRDNGRGIRAEQQQQSKSFGLLGMRERVAILGGVCTVQGEPGQGTTVQVKIPVPEKWGEAPVDKLRAAPPPGPGCP